MNVHGYCNGDITLIENYRAAIQDKDAMWECHHRLEHNPDGTPAYSSTELKAMDLYYGRPPSELIFLPASEHRRLSKKRNPGAVRHLSDAEDMLLYRSIDEDCLEIDAVVSEIEADRAAHPEAYKLVYRTWFCVREHDGMDAYVREMAKYSEDPEKYKSNFDSLSEVTL